MYMPLECQPRHAAVSRGLWAPVQPHCHIKGEACFLRTKLNVQPAEYSNVVNGTYRTRLLSW